MLKKLLPYRVLLFLIAIAVAIKLFSLQPAWVEKNYTYGIYPHISNAMRLLLGWLPFSFGDLIYAAAVIIFGRFILKTAKAARRNVSKTFWLQVFQNIMSTFLKVYILFNVLWGLNYNRQGIAHQLKLDVTQYNIPDVIQLTQILQTRLNTFAVKVDTVKRMESNTDSKLFQKAILVYREAGKNLTFLKYTTPSIKPSLYSGVGHYFGFTGYYNPFSGEAQIKTSIPVFLKPFVATHEIAHQLGYAKENEANFVAFLSLKVANDNDFLYSLYYNLYRYALREVYSRDTTAAMGFLKSLEPQAVRDNKELKAYFNSTENRIEPLISRFYDQYLKWNNQKAGVQTYNEVVALLIAYGKKFGWQAI